MKKKAIQFVEQCRKEMLDEANNEIKAKEPSFSRMHKYQMLYVMWCDLYTRLVEQDSFYPIDILYEQLLLPLYAEAARIVWDEDSIIKKTIPQLSKREQKEMNMLLDKHGKELKFYVKFNQWLNKKHPNYNFTKPTKTKA